MLSFRPKDAERLTVLLLLLVRSYRQLESQI